MRLVRPQKRRLARLELHEVQHKHTKYSHIPREILRQLANQPSNNLILYLPVDLDPSNPIPLHELLRLLLDLFGVCGHEVGEDFLESGGLGGVGEGEGDGRGGGAGEEGSDGAVREEGFELGDGGDEAGDLGKGSEVDESSEGGEGDGHLGLKGRGAGKGAI
jgi:hypothetical protein